MKQIVIRLLALCILISSILTACTSNNPNINLPVSEPSPIHKEATSDYSEQIIEESSTSSQEELDLLAQEAFDIWKSFGKGANNWFNSKETITEDHLIELYTEFCLNNNKTDEILKFPQEKYLNTNFQEYCNQVFLKKNGFVSFSKQYFGVIINKDASSLYVEKIDAYPISPSYLFHAYPDYSKIILESYDIKDNLIILNINYVDYGYYDLTIDILNDGSYVFDYFIGCIK